MRLTESYNPIVPIIIPSAGQAYPLSNLMILHALTSLQIHFLNYLVLPSYIRIGY